MDCHHKEHAFQRHHLVKRLDHHEEESTLALTPQPYHNVSTGGGGGGGGECLGGTNHPRTISNASSLSTIIIFTVTTIVLIINCTAIKTNAHDLNRPTETRITQSNHHQNHQILLNQPQAAPESAPTQGKLVANGSRIISTTNQEHYDKCQLKRSCRATARSRMLDIDGKKQSCSCDQACVKYDDCCHDSKFATPPDGRLNEKHLRSIRSQWYCQSTGLFGEVYIKASCSPEWLAANINTDAKRDQANHYQAETIRRNCEYITKAKQGDKNVATGDHLVDNNEEILPQLEDPLGMMMHITDLVNGLTYANSYCLQCNTIDMSNSKLIYWSPMLNCNYDIAKDDRNDLFDMVGKGEGLKYSKSLSKWIVDVPNNQTTRKNRAVLDRRHNTNSNNNNKRVRTTRMANMTHSGIGQNETASVAMDKKVALEDRVCNIEAVMPNSVEHMIRFCRAKVVDRCPTDPQVNLPKHNNTTNGISERDQLNKMNRTLVDECHLGYQALVYSQTSNLAYRNLACAHCNQEFNVHCEPKMRKVLPDGNQGRHLYPNPPEDGEQGTGQGSFSVLMDLYGSSHDDQQVGVVHQCASNNQIYDTFFSTCRDVICGLNRRYQSGKCVPDDHGLAPNLVQSTGGPAATSQHSNSTGRSNTQLAPLGRLNTGKSHMTPEAIDRDERVGGGSAELDSDPINTLAMENETTTHSIQSMATIRDALASDYDELIHSHPNQPAARQQTRHQASNKMDIVRGNTARLLDDNLATSERVRQPLAANRSSLDKPTGESLLTANQKFLECAKISIPAGQFTLTNRSSTLMVYVEAYNLTLEPNQYTLNRDNDSLLICSPFTTDLAPKFKPLMSIITTIGLIISITSLTLFLLLYVLSACVSCASRYKKNGGQFGGASHNSLASRGVVCLSASLLMAYLLFLGGQQVAYINQDFDTCVLVAIGTYFCFLMSFNWMFLLSFDVWRTLRLATCHLRGPIVHAQSKRFLIYMIYSLFISLTIVGASIYVEMQPLAETGPTLATNQSANNQIYTIIMRTIIDGYRPRFGQRQGICWFTNRRGLALFFGLPVTVIMLFNLIFFIHSSIMVIVTTTRSSRRPPKVPASLTCVSTTDSTEAPTKDINDYNNVRRKKLLISTKSSASLISTTTTSTFDCNQTGERMRYMTTRVTDEQPPIIEEHEYNEDEAKLNNRSGWDSIKRLFGVCSRKSMTGSSANSLHSNSSSYRAPSATTDDGNSTNNSIDNNSSNNNSGGNNNNSGNNSEKDAPDSYNNDNTVQSNIGGNNEMAQEIMVAQREMMAAPHQQQDCGAGQYKHIMLDSVANGGGYGDQDRAHQKSGPRPSLSLSNSSTLPLVDAKTFAEAQSKGSCSTRHLQQQLSLVLASVSKDYRLYWRLSTIMGLTWLTGVMASIVDNDILWYLFVILNTLQGLFIFIAFGCKRSKLQTLRSLLICCGLDRDQ